MSLRQTIWPYIFGYFFLFSNSFFSAVTVLASEPALQIDFSANPCLVTELSHQTIIEMVDII